MDVMFDKLDEYPCRNQQDRSMAIRFHAIIYMNLEEYEAYLRTGGYDFSISIKTEAEYQAFLRKLKNRTHHDRGTTGRTDDHVTLPPG